MAGLKSVLLVEDDVLIRELYRTTLVRDGFKTEIAGDSTEAFAKAKSFKPDVILLDVMLPGYSGMDILKELRTNPEYGCQQTRIMLLTNLAQQNLAETAMATGADGYIIKADILPDDLHGIIMSLE